MKTEHAERFALASLIRFPDLFEESGLSGDHFSDPKRRKIFTTIPQIPKGFRANDGSLPILRLAADAGLEQGDLVDVVRFGVVDREQAREAIALLGSQIDLANAKAEFAQLLASPIEDATELSAAAAEIASRYAGCGTTGLRSLDDVSAAVCDDYARRSTRPRAERCWTGFAKLDRRIRGLRPGELTTIFAGAGIGKSTFALQVVQNAVAGSAHAVYVSGEMTPEQIGERLLFAEAGISLDDEHPDVGRLQVAQRAIAQRGTASKIHCDFRYRTKPEQVIAEVRRLQALGKPIGVVVYDHLRHMEVRGARSEWDRLSLAIASAKEIAKAIPVHVLMLTHRNRTDGKESERPTLAGIKGSSNIGDDSDNVLALWRDTAIQGGATELLILKARQTGKTGTIHLMYDARYQTYSEV